MDPDHRRGRIGSKPRHTCDANGNPPDVYRTNRTLLLGAVDAAVSHQVANLDAVAQRRRLGQNDDEFTIPPNGRQVGDFFYGRAVIDDRRWIAAQNLPKSFIEYGDVGRQQVHTGKLVQQRSEQINAVQQFLRS